MKLSSVKSILAYALVILITIGIFPISIFANNALLNNAEISVNIISFMRGEQADIRSSELLMAQVSGYDGNVEELTYEWTSTLGTYLYVYNTHNMYSLSVNDDGEVGEVEIYNSSNNVGSSSNMSGRSYDGSFSGTGYAWASVYGAYSNASSALNGSITVTVKDKNNNTLCSDTVTGKKGTSGIKTHNLQSDLDYITIAIFEDQTKEYNIKDLLGQSSIVHITCKECSVTSARIISGKDHISLRQSRDDYFIKGILAGEVSDADGDAKLDVTVEKGNCKFHNKKSAESEIPVFVFKKPTTDTTSTTLTLTGDIDPRCEFYIHGAQGKKQSDGTVVFSGLTPDTEYEVEVRGKYIDDAGAVKYAYAYVTDTTKPVYDVSVYTYLNGVLTNFDEIKHISNQDISIKQDVPYSEAVGLNHVGTGKYTASVNEGSYYVWYKEGDNDLRVNDQMLVVDKSHDEVELHFYSVVYDTNGGNFENGNDTDKDHYYNGSSVNGTSDIPQKDGYVFVGWMYNDKLYMPGEQITTNINQPMELVAVWEELIDIKINVTINHGIKGAYDKSSTKDQLLVELLHKATRSYISTGKSISFNKNGVEGFDYVAVYGNGSLANEILTTKYVATLATFKDMNGGYEYTANATKPGYDTTIIPTKDENGDWTIDIVLTYNPDVFELYFTVKMDDAVPAELYPDAVIIKVIQYTENGWELIPMHEDEHVGVRVAIDKTNGNGYGVCNVNKFCPDGVTPAGNRIIIDSYVYGDNVVTATDTGNTYNIFTDGNCIGTIADVIDGLKYGSIGGAYYNEDDQTQNGILHADITILNYDVIFDAQGGSIYGNPTHTENNQYYVPQIERYIPIKENYEFLGWYLDAECTRPAISNAVLQSDVILYAKWNPIQTITGQVTLDGNTSNSSMVIDADKMPSQVIVVLQEITDSGARDIASQLVDITWNKNTNIGISSTYRFENVDGSKEYRIYVFVKSFESSYQNELTVSSGDKLSDAYNENDFKAIFVSDPIATYVNALLAYNPNTYWQDFKVDANAIGEGFRPSETLVQILYKYADSHDDAFKVVHKHTLSPFGILVTLNAQGLSSNQYGEYVWTDVWDGTPYDYQMKLATVVINDKNYMSDSKYPFVITYGDTSRWDPVANMPTNTLTAVLTPKKYTVYFDLNTNDTVTGMESYLDQNDNFTMSHTWSYGTDITAVPVRKGYKFIGWFDQNNNLITHISAAVSSNVYLKAVWEIDQAQTKPVEYTVQHIVDGVVMDQYTQSIVDQVWINAENSTIISAGVLKPIDFVGYKFFGVLGGVQEGDMVTNGAVISLLYDKDLDATKTVSYTVQHVIGNVVKDTDTYIDTVWVNDASELAILYGSLNIKDYYGYKFDSINFDVTIGDIVEDGTVITFTYIPDRNVTVDVHYYVNHCVDGAIKDTVEFTETIWVHDSKKLAIVEGTYNLKDYTGYKYTHTDFEAAIGTEVEDGKIITIYYDKDKSVLKDVSYTVEHIVDGTVMSQYTQIFTDKVWINDDSSIVVGALVPVEFKGYKFNGVLSDVKEGDSVASGSVISLIYDKDLNNTKTIGYTVQHVVNGNILDTNTYFATVWVNDAYQLAIQEGSVDINNYYGFKYDSINIDVSSGDIVNDGTVIILTYVPDRNVTVDIHYYVQHCVDGVIMDTITYTETVWVNDEKELTILDGTYNLKNYVGYKYIGTDYDGAVGSKIDDGKIITINYDKDLSTKKTVSYTVMHVVGGKTIASKTYSENIWINDADTIIVDNDTIEAMSIYGYEFAGIENKPIDNNNVVESGTVIKLYYAPQMCNYSVQYYYDDVLDADKTEYLEALYGSVIINCPDKQIAGYSIDGTEGLPLTIDMDESKNVIKIFYKITMESVEPSGDSNSMLNCILFVVAAALLALVLCKNKKTRLNI